MLHAACRRSLALAVLGIFRWPWKGRAPRKAKAAGKSRRASRSTPSPLDDWHSGRLSTLSSGLDWSRCFVSVLFVDSARSPCYVRARLAQRLADAAAEWNGMGRVLEFYACSTRDEPDGSDGSGISELFSEAGAVKDSVSEFAENVGIDEEELQQILRKLGAGMWVALSQEALREHDVVIALDDDAAAAVNDELVRQGLPAGCMLLSDFEWQLLHKKKAFLETNCADGSGERFLTPAALQAMERHAFEFGERLASKQPKHIATLATGKGRPSPLLCWFFALFEFRSKASECRRPQCSSLASQARRVGQKRRLACIVVVPVAIAPRNRAPTHTHIRFLLLVSTCASLREHAVLAACLCFFATLSHVVYASKDSSVGDWRRLHAALMQGSWGLVWFLFLSWQARASARLFAMVSLG